MMCATGMESADEELNAVLQSQQQNPTHVTLAGAVSAGTSSSGGGAAFREVQQSFSELPAMLGSGSTRPYNDSSGNTKHNSMTTQTMNPYQDQGGRNFGPSTPIPPKNGLRRQGLWSGGNRNYMNGGGRNGEQEIDPRLQVPDYPSALLDQTTIPLADPFRPSGGGLSRYHSAPSSFLASLAADFQQDSPLSSFLNDADLPQLNATSDSSLDMDTEQSSSTIFDDKFLLDTRKFERIGGPQLGGPGPGGGLVSQKSLQSSFKPSMEVVLENQTVSSQMPSSTQIPASSQIPSMTSGLCMPSSMGLCQQISSSQQMIGQQQINPMVNLTGNMAGNMIIMGNGLGSEFISNGPSGALGGLGSGRPNNLLRQSSSPAGLLAQLSIDAQGQIPKIEKQSLSSPTAHSPEDSMSGGTSEENVGTTGMLSGMDAGVWEDAANSYMNSWGNDTFSQRKRFRDNMDLGDIMGPSETSGRVSLDHGPAPGSLTRHMSLPTPKSKVVLPDDILQSVPCRIRAKRGCATHPRSIAERVRRTRISERMRKLQELVPNMDKQQTNTADMLDEAVEYVKQLQRQVQELTESQAKCNGSCHQDHKTTVT